MANIFIFHGTGGFPEENWFPWMKRELEKHSHKVIVPQFPTPENQTPENWLEVLSQYKDKIDKDTLMIGHSLGGLFLVKVLEQLKKPIKAAVFVATPIGIPPVVNWAGDAPFLTESFEWKKIKQNAGIFIVYHSDNDPYVGLENGMQLAKNLGAELTFVSNAGHFNTKAGYLKFEKLRDKVLEIV